MCIRDRLYDSYAEKGLENMACIIDTNHSNSSKQYMAQIRIANEVMHSRRHSDDIKKLVKGFMIESYLEDGNQKIGEGVFGKSLSLIHIFSGSKISIPQSKCLSLIS